MIAIASNTPRERLALAALCAGYGWNTTECDSVRAFMRLIHRSRPTVVLVRHRLGDGFSDDVIARLAALQWLPQTKVIVLVEAGTPSSTEVRQLSLGADCVQRDPIRTDVLVSYVAKYVLASRRDGASSPRTPPATTFCGAVLNVIERTLRLGAETVLLTPREVALVEQLAHSADNVVTYERLYQEILGRPFKGDTSNMRVLLGKLGGSMRSMGIALNLWVEVLPKTGYRYKSRLAGI